MKIDKITFKNEQAWVVIRDHVNEYLGTWHVIQKEAVDYLRQFNPKELHFEKGLVENKINQVVDEIYRKDTEVAKDEVKGCGKDMPTGVPPNIWDCTKPCGSGGYLCEKCQSVAKLEGEGK